MRGERYPWPLRVQFDPEALGSSLAGKVSITVYAVPSAERRAAGAECRRSASARSHRLEASLMGLGYFWMLGTKYQCSRAKFAGSIVGAGSGLPAVAVERERESGGGVVDVGGLELEGQLDRLMVLALLDLAPEALAR